MRKQQSSPAQLNNTQSLLTSLYERIMKSTSDSPEQSFKKKTIHQKKDNHRIQNPSGRQSYQINTKQSPLVQQSLLYTEPNKSDKKRQVSCFSDQISNSIQHIHSYSCCSVKNTQISSRLKKCEKNQMLLQSYRQQVEYLKKLTFLQSQQIEKLRRMLRSQQQKNSIQKNYLHKSVELDNSSKTIIQNSNQQHKNAKNKQKPKIMNRKLSHLKNSKDVKKTTKRKNSHI